MSQLGTIRSMAVKAVAAYIRRLRKQRNMTQQAVAEAVGMSLRHYNRWENAPTGGTEMATFMEVLRVVGASFDDAQALWNDPEATAADGYARAEHWIHQQRQAAMRAELTPMSPPNLDAAIDRFQTLLDRAETAAAPRVSLVQRLKLRRKRRNGLA